MQLNVETYRMKREKCKRQFESVGNLLFGLMVEWLQSPACHVGGTGSNPVGTARKYARFIGIFQAYSKIPLMGVHVPRLAMDLCKVRGRVRFSSSPQVGYKRIFNYGTENLFAKQMSMVFFLNDFQILANLKNIWCSGQHTAPGTQATEDAGAEGKVQILEYYLKTHI